VACTSQRIFPPRRASSEETLALDVFRTTRAIDEVLQRRMEMKFDRTIRNVKRYADDLDVDDVLELVGLQRHRSGAGYILPTLGIIAAGVLVGAGLGLMFAPTTGRSLRREAENKVHGLKDRIRQSTNEVGRNINDVANNNAPAASPSI
jgi:hypothetical protein